MKNSICPITFFGDKLIRDTDLNASLLLPFTEFNVDIYNYEIMPDIMVNFIYSNLYDLYNCFTMNIIETSFKDNKETMQILIQGLGLFNTSQNPRSYMEKILGESFVNTPTFFSITDMSFNETDSYKESAVSLLYMALLNTIDYAFQFIVQDYVSLSSTLYKTSLILCDMNAEHELSKKDQYVFCMNLIRQAITFNSNDIRCACSYIIDSVINMKNMYKSSVNSDKNIIE